VWQHPIEELLVHFVFDRESRSFVGVNCFGIRMRHELMDHWLNEQKTIYFVLENLAAANFDPEFYARYEQEIIDAFNKQFDTQLKAKSKMWWQKLLTN